MIFLLFLSATGSTYEFPNGDPRNCMTTNSSIVAAPFDTLPGKGWDNLRNLDQSLVLAYNYSRCKVTSDGKFLVPNNVDAIPLRQSNQDISTRLFTRKLNFTSSTSYSVNANLGVYSIISGKFSLEYERFSSTFREKRGRASRIQLDHPRYVLKAQPSSNLHPQFKNRIFQIAASLQTNNTQLAKYLSQLIIKDYGTHYIHTTTVGGLLTKTDFLQMETDELSEGSRRNLESGAQIDFKKKVQAGFGFANNHDRQLHSQYLNSITSSSLDTHGGPLFTTNTSIFEWESGIEKEMVSIDRDGDPLQTLVSPYVIPEIPPDIILQVAQLITTAADKYYKVNTYKGCTNPTSDNYNPQANIDDHSCAATGKMFKFGGVYQTCKSDKISICEKFNMEQKNLATGAYSCPSGYHSVRLLQGSRFFTVNEPRCWDQHSSCGFLGWGRCVTGQFCQPNFIKYSISYETFWCYSDASGSQNFLFGGIFSDERPNPFTGSLSCPKEYQRVRFTAKGYVCMTSDVELGMSASLPFAGFHSCKHGNPLASKTKPAPKDCPKGYAQHLGMIANDCEVNYCLKAGALSAFQNQKVRRPPFMDIPESILNKSQDYFLLANDGSIWINKYNSKEDLEDDHWKVISPSNVNYSEVAGEVYGQKVAKNGSLGGSDNGHSMPISPPIAGIIGAGIATAVFMIFIVILFTIRRCTRKKKNYVPMVTEAAPDACDTDSIRYHKVSALPIDPAQNNY